MRRDGPNTTQKKPQKKLSEMPILALESGAGLGGDSRGGRWKERNRPDESCKTFVAMFLEMPAKKAQ